MAEFRHPNYTLVDGDKIVRNKDAPKPTFQEDGEVIQEITRYVQSRMVSDFGFVPLTIPQEDATATTTILASPDWQTAKKLLVIIQNASGSLMGIFSRSLCLDKGLSKGSMLNYVKRARDANYAVMILRPNTNSVMTESNQKLYIQGAETPEAHAMFVWENIIPKAEKVRHIVLLGYGNGASLCKDLFLRQMVRSKQDEADVNHIRGFITIEASHILEDDDAADIKTALGSMAVNMECKNHPKGYLLKYREKLGCPTVCLGVPADASGGSVQNVAASCFLALDPVFDYIAMTESVPHAQLSATFVKTAAEKNGHNPANAVVTVNPNADELPATPKKAAQPPTPPPKQGFFSRLFGLGNKNSDKYDEGVNDKLTVADFDLLKVVGKGAFGKVMLVRKKGGDKDGAVYAMKVLKKSVVAAKGQIENTKSERSILCEIRHPYIVRLRFAFQSEDKLYLVTDYYNGGSLFYHLRKSRAFTEERARFYGAQLLTALEHLHSQHIVYRDLKLENILMDNVGNIALTDFGLSKQNIDESGGATTFCGTAEYIAPELLKGQKYGNVVDWWSFGILLFEMIHGKTPFFDKNRKLMFYRIINTAPSFPSTFSPEACEVIRGLLNVKEEQRLGSLQAGGPSAIKRTAFFSVIDFDKLMEKALPPPFTPEVVNELDTKYVPKAFLDAEAKDSFSEKKKGEQHQNFDAFTFAGESALGGDEER